MDDHLTDDRITYLENEVERIRAEKSDLRTSVMAIAIMLHEGMDYREVRANLLNACGATIRESDS